MTSPLLCHESGFIGVSMNAFTRFSKYFIVLGLTIIPSLLAVTGSAQPPAQNFETLSEILHSPEFNDIEVEGNRLYAATGYGLEVFDISNPQQPVSLGRQATDGIATTAQPGSGSKQRSEHRNFSPSLKRPGPARRRRGSQREALASSFRNTKPRTIGRR